MSDSGTIYFQSSRTYDINLSWTSDPFDRLIVAHALADDAWLLTADREMRRHTRLAFWDKGA